jgi:hypothetical protein
MKLIRVVFFGLAVLLPTSWTIARADDAPAEGSKDMKKSKKSKKSKKAEKPEGSEEKKAE